MDYASATPGDGQNWENENVYWHGDIWDLPHDKKYYGIIVRVNWDIRPGPGTTANSSPPTTFAHIRDGASNTLLLGDKLLSPDKYLAGDKEAISAFTRSLEPTCGRWTVWRASHLPSGRPAQKG